MKLPDSKKILAELETCSTEDQLKAFFATYLGKKGSVNGLFKEMKGLSPEEKKTKGQEIKALFDEINTAFMSKQDEIKRSYRDEKLQEEIVDISTPGIVSSGGHSNLQNQLRRKVEQIFQGMGFHIEYGHDLVNTFENFSSVNIPPSHPATEMHDTLYINSKNSEGQKLLLRTHTSAHQNELIKKLGPTCKFIIPGKVYRNENMDASHDTVFRQVEGVVIDKGLSIGHFKGMMQKILQGILETDQVELRLRPAYFPFVEPGFEIDAKTIVGNKEKRLEILGAGMIHSSVLEQAGVDPTVYSGFAFGLGMTRLVAIRYGLNDIRLLTNGDLRFAHSF